MMNNVTLMFPLAGEKTPYEQGENKEIKKKKNEKVIFLFIDSF